MTQFPQHTRPPSNTFNGANVTALLGPTNTGKTHYAIERMLTHGSGMIGLPLRLLAREVYGRVVEKVGAAKVALLTGEEKIIPPGARYWVCTVEAMPSSTHSPELRSSVYANSADQKLDFIAIDEVQLCGDLERGHVFTDRVLNRRGLHETLLLGADTIRPLLTRLLPGLTTTARARLSKLSYTGSKKISRLPPRSAVVAFSAAEVYAIAELLRRQKGGAAVVMGALSPRTRNAQVALYQAGDVEHLVATDAIGMGLNLDVEHIAFAASRKFDGFHYRALNPAELAQIAGRAGRYLNDGTFGVTGQQDEFDIDLVQQIEAHDFEPLTQLQWRSSRLDYASIKALQHSLEQSPPLSGLTRSPLGEDQAVLDMAARDPRFSDLRGADDVALLWEVCQIPDYRKLSMTAHAELCLDIGGFLLKVARIPHDWMNQQLEPLKRLDGDIDTLQARLSSIRIWTFVANRSDWVFDPAHWRERTRALEDQLSDALHEKLTQRFIDRRTSMLARRLRDRDMLETQISADGDVIVEGEKIGTLNGFRFTPDAASEGSASKTLRAAAAQVVGGAITARAQLLAEAPNDQLILSSDNHIRWKGQDVARLVPGTSEIEPDLRLSADEHLTGTHRDWVEARLKAFVRHAVSTQLKPLVDLKAAEHLTGLARGIAFQLVENLGILDRAKVADDVKALDQSLRGDLRKLGLRFGAQHLYLPLTLKPKPRALAAQLWLLKHGKETSEAIDKVLQLALSGRTTWIADTDIEPDLYRVLGYKILGTRAVRVDILERLSDLIRPLTSYNDQAATSPPPEGRVGRKGFLLTPAMTSLLGSSSDDMGQVLRALGYVSDVKPKDEADMIVRKTHEDYAGRMAKLDAAKAAAAAVEPVAASATVANDTSSAVVETAAVETPAVDTDETVSKSDENSDLSVENASVESEKPNEINEGENSLSQDDAPEALQDSDTHQTSAPETPVNTENTDISRETISPPDTNSASLEMPVAGETDVKAQALATVEIWHFPRRTFDKRPARRPHHKAANGEAVPERLNQNSERPARPHFKKDFKGEDGKPQFTRDKPKDGARERRDESSKRKPFNKDRNDKPRDNSKAAHRMVFSTEDKSAKTLDANNPFAALAALKNQMGSKS